MMTAENNSSAAKRKDPPGVLCAKCDHLNPPGSTECDSCHAELFRVCKVCHKTYQAAYSKCVFCGAKGRRQEPRHSGKRLAPQSISLKWVYAAALLIALALCYKIFQKVGNMNFGS